MSKHSNTQIVELEECLRQAMLNSDVAELDRLIAPELLFTNHLGQLVSKEQDLALHRSGMLKLAELTPSDQHMQLNEGFSVVAVKMYLLGTYDSTKINEYIRYTRVWSLSSAGAVQIVAGHSSVVAA